MIVRSATIKELTDWWDKKVNENTGDNSWVEWRKTFIEENESGKRKTFFAFDENQNYIGQCTLLFEGHNKVLTGNSKAELIKLELTESERGKGYATKIFETVKEYAKDNGIKTLTIGVEPSEIKNMQIYFHWGFTNFLECRTETFPPKKQGEKGEEIIVLGYSQEI